MAKVGILMLGIVVVLSTVGAAWAQFEGSAGLVEMGAYTFLQIRCPVAGYSIVDRAGAVQRRLNDLLVLGGFDLDTIKVVESGQDAAVHANNKLLVTATPCDARANNTTTAKLARHWAKRLRDIYPLVSPKEPAIATERRG